MKENQCIVPRNYVADNLVFFKEYMPLEKFIYKKMEELMQLLEAKYKIKCEMGACKNTATHTVKLSRVGIKSQIHICKNCLNELAGLINKEIVPKSLETLKGDSTKKTRIKKSEK